MKTIQLMYGLISFLILAGCQRSGSSDQQSPNVTPLGAESMNWQAAYLTDVPNQPRVFVASRNGDAYVAMIDSVGKTMSAIVSLDGEGTKIETNSFDVGILKSVEVEHVVETSFARLKDHLIKNQIQAAGRCRSSVFSEAIRKSAYENRDGAVLLKLNDAWSNDFSGFEIAIALDPKDGSFQNFTITKSLTFSTISFFAVPDSLILAGPKGQVVRDLTPWISECSDAYARVQRHKYRADELEKMDQDASALVDLDARIGVFKNLYYEFNHISLEELKH